MNRSRYLIVAHPSSVHLMLIKLAFYLHELRAGGLIAAILSARDTAFSISVRYLHICAPCRQRVADLLRIKDCRAATLCRRLFQNLINVITILKTL